MYKKMFLVLFFVVILAMSVIADKDTKQSWAASPCATCQIDIPEVTTIHDQLGYGIMSDHIVTGSSSGIFASYVDVSFRIPDTDASVTINFREVYLFDATYTVSQESVDGYDWFHIHITSHARIYDDTPIFRFQVVKMGCVAETHDLPIELAQSSFGQNQFGVSGDTYTIGIKNNGAQKIEEPNVYVHVIPDGEDWTYIYESYVGAIVSVPVYFQCNLDYPGGFEVTVSHNTNLIFDSWTPSYYSYNATVDASVEGEVTFTMGPNSLSVTEPDFPDTRFLTIDFKIDDDVTPGSEFYLGIVEDYRFTTCDDYEYFDHYDQDVVRVNTALEEITVKLQSMAVYNDDMGFAWGVSINTPVPIKTDAPDEEYNTRFSVNESDFEHTEFKHVTPTYSFSGGVINWIGMHSFGAYKGMGEDPNQASNVISPTDYTFEYIGSMNLDPVSNGTDYIDFNTSDPGYNYTKVKYTDHIIDQTNGLSFDDGYITVRSHCTNCGGGGGCPTLYIWDGLGYALENPILTYSQYQVDPIAQDDYYQLSNIVEKDGYYNIQIREYRDEITFLDQAELIVANYPLDSDIGISTEGMIYAKKEPIEPIAAFDEWNNDLLPLVSKMDGSLFEADEPGSLILTYPNPNYGKQMSQNKGYALGNTPPTPKAKKFVDSDFKIYGENVYSEIEDINGNWHYLGGTAPRSYETQTTSWLADADDYDLGETFRIRISWQIGYKVDQQALAVTEPANVTQHRLMPIEADHTRVGKIANSLNSTDGDIITLSPGETIDLKFEVPETSNIEGYGQKFFFKANGYYRAFKFEDGVPDSFELFDNYPNPFNPITNIRFSVPKTGEISLAVFNLLGQKVKTLHEGEIDAGNHTIQWSGDNDNNQQVASGVYFYKLITKDFEQSKKMVLLK